MSQILILQNGKKLGYAVYGDSQASRAAFYMHGFPGSRIEGSIMQASALKLGFKIIAPERFGYGLSDPDPERTIANWPSSVGALADHLGISSFYMIGLSGGGAYATSCALALRERVLALALLSSMGPIDTPDGQRGTVLLNRMLLALGKHLPAISVPVFKTVGTVWRLSPSAARRWLRLILHSSDQQVLGSSDIAQVFEANVTEALRNSIEGACKDFELMTRAWRLDLSKIACPTKVWHGDADNYVSPAMGQYLADAIPGAIYTNIPGAGHFGALRVIPDVLEWLGSSPSQRNAVS